MRNNGFPLLFGIGIITLVTACDNVGWGGVQVEVRAPESLSGADSAAEAEAPADLSSTPIETGPLLYLVERVDGASASLTPIAQRGDEGYLPLPDLNETPDLMARFPIERWEPGSEFVLFDQGTRVGTFVSSGLTSGDELGCTVRPMAAGFVELHPSADASRRFLAFRKDDPGPAHLPGSYPGHQVTANLRAGSLAVSGAVIPRVEAPWPPSVQGAQQDLSVISFGDGTLGFATSLLFGDRLEIGVPEPLGYSILAIGHRGSGTFQPLWSWYQRADRGGKASPRFAAAHDVRGTGEPDLLLEVFGAEARWWAIAGVGAAGWELVYQDACGTPAAEGSTRSYP